MFPRVLVFICRPACSCGGHGVSARNGIFPPPRGCPLRCWLVHLPLCVCAWVVERGGESPRAWGRQGARPKGIANSARQPSSLSLRRSRFAAAVLGLCLLAGPGRPARCSRRAPPLPLSPCHGFGTGEAARSFPAGPRRARPSERVQPPSPPAFALRVGFSLSDPPRRWIPARRHERLQRGLQAAQRGTAASCHHNRAPHSRGEVTPAGTRLAHACVPG